MSRLSIILAGCLALAGCGGGGGYKPPAGTDPSPPTLLALDLDTGALVEVPAGSAPSTRILRFHRVDSGTGPRTASDAITETVPDDDTSSGAVPTFAIGTHEITQAQWALLARFAPTDATPWTALTPYTGLGGPGCVSPTKPAFGLSHAVIARVLAAWNTGTRHRLRLPTDREWEYACRGGNGGTDQRYGWGAGGTAGDALPYALVRETATGPGPGSCGALAATTPLRLFDMHGNVWEWVTVPAGQPRLRGGSWNDNLLSAACGNAMDCPADAPYATAGVRLVLELP